MVKICNEPYPSNSKYDSNFELYPYSLSDFQKYAIEAIVEKQHVLVTAHTGSGKTLPAEFAIQHFAKQGKKVIYTSPIKALSNQKYYEFTKKFPEISFGLFTGDIKTNPDADVLIMTTEILMNYLFTSKPTRMIMNLNLLSNFKWIFKMTLLVLYLMKSIILMTPIVDKHGRRLFSCFRDTSKWLCFRLRLIIRKDLLDGVKKATLNQTQNVYIWHQPVIA